MSSSVSPSNTAGSSAQVAALCAIALGLALVPSPALAQGRDGHWTVGLSFTPKWKANKSLQEKLLGWEGNTLEGSEFTVGVGRGSTLGGDWSVNYVQKPFKDGAPFSEVEQNCFQSTCLTTSQTSVMRDVIVKGVEYQWYRPFGTFKERVQIGLGLAGGVGFPEGIVENTLVQTSSFTDPRTGRITTDTFSDSFTEDADEVFYPYIALIKVEVQGAIIVTPQLKIKLAGGLNAPSAGSFRLGLVYLIGAK